jgi:hypothetical protein
VIQGAFPVRPSLPSIVGNEGVGRVSGPPQAMACRFDAAALYSVPHQEWG